MNQVRAIKEDRAPYFETSAKTREGLEAVFNGLAVLAAVQSK